MATLSTHQNRLALNCAFRDKDLAQTVRGARWLPSIKSWTYPLDPSLVRELAELFPNLFYTERVNSWYKATINRDNKRIELKRAEDCTEIDHDPRLYPYQRVGIDFLRADFKTLIADQMRLGKTAQVIRAVDPRAKKLIICPNTAKYVWEEEIAKWSPRVLDEIEIFQGSLPKIDNPPPHWTIINYEAVKLHHEIYNRHFDYLILDEGHRIKNRKTAIFKFIKKIKTKNVVIVTGTPILNRPDELWALLHILYPERYTSYWSFVNSFCELEEKYFHGNTFKVITDSKNTEKLKQILNPIMIRRTRKEVKIQLPEKIYQEVLLDLEGDQKKLYQQMEEDMRAQLGEVQLLAGTFIERTTRLRQLAIHPSLCKFDNYIKTTPKIAYLQGLLESAEGKIVVFSMFTSVLDLMKKDLEETLWVEISGKVVGRNRAKAMENFRKIPEARICFATIGAGGEAINLSAADICLFVDKSWVPYVNDQAEDRLLGHGQKDPVEIITLISKDTIEERLLQVLRKKREMIKHILEPQEIRFILGGN